MASATLKLTIPMPTLAAYTGPAIIVTMPMVDFNASGHDATGERAIDLTMPMLTLAAYGGTNVAATMPMVKLGASGTVTSMANIAVTLPRISLDASGRVAASANMAMTMPMATVIGYGGSVISVTMGSITLEATGRAGGLAQVALTMPMFDLVATGTAQSHGAVNLIMPMLQPVNSGAIWMLAPMVQLVASGSAVVIPTYEGYALNLKHNPVPGVEPVDELTHYSNYPFDRIVRYKNSYFGMNSAGLYLLEGTTDNGTVIPWSYRTHKTDFKSVQLKNVSMAYFGGRMGPAASVYVYVGESSTAPYTYTTPRDATAQNYRQPLGRGLKSRYYAFGASGTGGMTLDSLSINEAILARKV